MTELRLLDADGYTVPGGIRDATPETEAAVRADLTQLATEHAAVWADSGYHLADYRITPNQGTLMDNAQVNAALTAVADLMEQDEFRTRNLYGSPVGIPVSMGDYLIHQACYGPITDHRLEWVRVAKDESVAAANAWSAEKMKLRILVSALVYPSGAQSESVNASGVRHIAASYRIV